VNVLVFGAIDLEAALDERRPGRGARGVRAQRGGAPRVGERARPAPAHACARQRLGSGVRREPEARGSAPGGGEERVDGGVEPA